MEGVLGLLFVIALVTLFCARKALQRAYTRSYRLPPLSPGNPISREED